MSRGRAVVARQAHNLKVDGSIPSPATKNFLWKFRKQRTETEKTEDFFKNLSRLGGRDFLLIHFCKTYEILGILM
jgi:hypothetical protein